MARLDTGKVKTRADAPSTQPKSTLAEQAIRKPGVPTNLKGVLFGPPKTGKTTAACSGGRTLLINFDPEGYATETLTGREDIDIIEPSNLLEANQVIKQILGGEAEAYDFVVVDSVTFMFQKFDGGAIAKDFVSGKDIRRAYGMAGAACQQVIHDLSMLPATNVIFVAHLQKEFDDDSVSQDQDLGEHEVSLAVTPMVWKILGPSVGFIGRTFRKTAKDLDSGNTTDGFYVSFNDGARSPAGSRYKMEAEYQITDTLLTDLAIELL
jgi:hypothetical protein